MWSIDLVSKLNKEGSQTAVINTEHTIADYDSSGTSQRWYAMYLDTAALQSGDTLEVRVYAMITSGGTLRRYRMDTISNAQTDPCWYLPPMPNWYGFRITIKQVSGTARTFPYLIFEQ